MTEAEAISRLKNDDTSGLDALLQKYQVTAVRAACLITRDRALAEDVVQDAFVRAYQRIHQLRSPDMFGPWFMRSVINAAKKAAIRKERTISLDRPGTQADLDLISLIPDEAPGPHDLAAQYELRQEVKEALNKLTPLQRAVLVQRYYLGYSEAASAADLDCAPGTVKSRLHNAKEHLRRLLSIPRQTDTTV